MKRLTAIVLTVILILGFTACGGGDAENKPPSDLKESPASDFEYKYNAELNGIEITKYIGR